MKGTQFDVAVEGSVEGDVAKWADLDSFFNTAESDMQATRDETGFHFTATSPKTDLILCYKFADMDVFVPYFADLIVVGSLYPKHANLIETERSIVHVDLNVLADSASLCYSSSEGVQAVQQVSMKLVAASDSFYEYEITYNGENLGTSSSAFNLCINYSSSTSGAFVNAMDPSITFSYKSLPVFTQNRILKGNENTLTFSAVGIHASDKLRLVDAYNTKEHVTEWIGLNMPSTTSVLKEAQVTVRVDESVESNVYAIEYCMVFDDVQGCHIKQLPASTKLVYAFNMNSVSPSSVFLSSSTRVYLEGSGFATGDVVRLVPLSSNCDNVVAQATVENNNLQYFFTASLASSPYTTLYVCYYSSAFAMAKNTGIQVSLIRFDGLSVSNGLASGTLSSVEVYGQGLAAGDKIKFIKQSVAEQYGDCSMGESQEYTVAAEESAFFLRSVVLPRAGEYGVCYKSQGANYVFINNDYVFRSIEGFARSEQIDKMIVDPAVVSEFTLSLYGSFTISDMSFFWMFENDEAKYMQVDIPVQMANDNVLVHFDVDSTIGKSGKLCLYASFTNYGSALYPVPDASGNNCVYYFSEETQTNHLEGLVGTTKEFDIQLPLGTSSVEFYNDASALVGSYSSVSRIASFDVISESVSGVLTTSDGFTGRVSFVSMTVVGIMEIMPFAAFAKKPFTLQFSGVGISDSDVVYISYDSHCSEVLTSSPVHDSSSTVTINDVNTGLHVCYKFANYERYSVYGNLNVNSYDDQLMFVATNDYTVDLSSLITSDFSCQASVVVPTTSDDSAHLSSKLSGSVANIFDSNPETGLIFQSTRSESSSESPVEYPHWFIVEMDSCTSISSFEIYLSGTQMDPREITLQYSTYGDFNYWTDVATLTFERPQYPGYISSLALTSKFRTSGRYFRFLINSNQGGDFTRVLEMRLYASPCQDDSFGPLIYSKWVQMSEDESVDCTLPGVMSPLGVCSLSGSVNFPSSGYYGLCIRSADDWVQIQWYKASVYDITSVTGPVDVPLGSVQTFAIDGFVLSEGDSAAFISESADCSTASLLPLTEAHTIEQTFSGEAGLYKLCYKFSSIERTSTMSKFTLRVMEGTITNVVPFDVLRGVEQKIYFNGLALSDNDKVAFTTSETCDALSEESFVPVINGETGYYIMSTSVPEGVEMTICYSFSGLPAKVVAITKMSVRSVTSTNISDTLSVGFPTTIVFSGFGLSSGDSFVFVTSYQQCTSANFISPVYQVSEALIDGAVQYASTVTMNTPLSGQICYLFKNQASYVKISEDIVVVNYPAIHRLTPSRVFQSSEQRIDIEGTGVAGMTPSESSYVRFVETPATGAIDCESGIVPINGQNEVAVQKDESGYYVTVLFTTEVPQSIVLCYKFAGKETYVPQVAPFSVASFESITPSSVVFNVPVSLSVSGRNINSNDKVRFVPEGETCLSDDYLEAEVNQGMVFITFDRQPTNYLACLFINDVHAPNTIPIEVSMESFNIDLTGSSLSTIIDYPTTFKILGTHSTIQEGAKASWTYSACSQYIVEPTLIVNGEFTQTFPAVVNNAYLCIYNQSNQGSLYNSVLLSVNSVFTVSPTVVATNVTRVVSFDGIGIHANDFGFFGFNCSDPTQRYTDVFVLNENKQATITFRKSGMNVPLCYAFNRFTYKYYGNITISSRSIETVDIISAFDVQGNYNSMIRVTGTGIGNSVCPQPSVLSDSAEWVSSVLANGMTMTNMAPESDLATLFNKEDMTTSVSVLGTASTLTMNMPSCQIINSISVYVPNEESADSVIVSYMNSANVINVAELSRNGKTESWVSTGILNKKIETLVLTLSKSTGAAMNIGKISVSGSLCTADSSMKLVPSTSSCSEVGNYYSSSAINDCQAEAFMNAPIDKDFKLCYQFLGEEYFYEYPSLLFVHSVSGIHFSSGMETSIPYGLSKELVIEGTYPENTVIAFIRASETMSIFDCSDASKLVSDVYTIVDGKATVTINERVSTVYMCYKFPVSQYSIFSAPLSVNYVMPDPEYYYLSSRNIVTLRGVGASGASVLLTKNTECTEGITATFGEASSLSINNVFSTGEWHICVAFPSEAEYMTEDSLKFVSFQAASPTFINKDVNSKIAFTGDFIGENDKVVLLPHDLTCSTARDEDSQTVDAENTITVKKTTSTVYQVCYKFAVLNDNEYHSTTGSVTVVDAAAPLIDISFFVPSSSNEYKFTVSASSIYDHVKLVQGNCSNEPIEVVYATVVDRTHASFKFASKLTGNDYRLCYAYSVDEYNYSFDLVKRDLQLMDLPRGFIVTDSVPVNAFCFMNCENLSVAFAEDCSASDIVFTPYVNSNGNVFIPFTSSANIVSLCGKFSDSPYHYTLAENVKVVRFEGISISSWIYNVPYPDEYSIHGDEPLTIYMSFVNPNSNDRLYFVPYNPSEQLPCSLDVVKRYTVQYVNESTGIIPNFIMDYGNGETTTYVMCYNAATYAHNNQIGTFTIYRNSLSLSYTTSSNVITSGTTQSVHFTVDGPVSQTTGNAVVLTSAEEVLEYPMNTNEFDLDIAPSESAYDVSFRYRGEVTSTGLSLWIKKFDRLSVNGQSITEIAALENYDMLVEGTGVQAGNKVRFVPLSDTSCSDSTVELVVDSEKHIAVRMNTNTDSELMVCYQFANEEFVAYPDHVFSILGISSIIPASAQVNVRTKFIITGSGLSTRDSLKFILNTEDCTSNTNPWMSYNPEGIHYTFTESNRYTLCYKYNTGSLVRPALYIDVRGLEVSSSLDFVKDQEKEVTFSGLVVSGDKLKFARTSCEENGIPALVGEETVTVLDILSDASRAYVSLAFTELFKDAIVCIKYVESETFIQLPGTVNVYGASALTKHQWLTGVAKQLSLALSDYYYPSEEDYVKFTLLNSDVEEVHIAHVVDSYGRLEPVTFAAAGVYKVEYYIAAIDQTYVDPTNFNVEKQNVQLDSSKNFNGILFSADAESAHEFYVPIIGTLNYVVSTARYVPAGEECTVETPVAEGSIASNYDWIFSVTGATHLEFCFKFGDNEYVKYHDLDISVATITGPEEVAYTLGASKTIVLSGAGIHAGDSVKYVADGKCSSETGLGPFTVASSESEFVFTLQSNDLEAVESEYTMCYKFGSNSWIHYNNTLTLSGITSISTKTTYVSQISFIDLSVLNAAETDRIIFTPTMGSCSGESVYAAALEESSVRVQFSAPGLYYICYAHNQDTIQTSYTVRVLEVPESKKVNMLESSEYQIVVPEDTCANTAKYTAEIASVIAPSACAPSYLVDDNAYTACAFDEEDNTVVLVLSAMTAIQGVEVYLGANANEAKTFSIYVSETATSPKVFYASATISEIAEAGYYSIAPSDNLYKIGSYVYIAFTNGRIVSDLHVIGSNVLSAQPNYSVAFVSLDSESCQSQVSYDVIPCTGAINVPASSIPENAKLCVAKKTDGYFLRHNEIAFGNLTASFSVSAPVAGEKSAITTYTSGSQYLTGLYFSKNACRSSYATAALEDGAWSVVFPDSAQDTQVVLCASWSNPIAIQAYETYTVAASRSASAGRRLIDTEEISVEPTVVVSNVENVFTLSGAVDGDQLLFVSGDDCTQVLAAVTIENASATLSGVEIDTAVSVCYKHEEQVAMLPVALTVYSLPTVAAEPALTAGVESVITLSGASAAVVQSVMFVPAASACDAAIYAPVAIESVQGAYKPMIPESSVSVCYSINGQYYKSVASMAIAAAEEVVDVASSEFDTVAFVGIPKSIQFSDASIESVGWILADTDNCDPTLFIDVSMSRSGSAFVFTFQAAYSELAMCVKRVSEDAYEYANKSISVVSIDGVQNVSFLVKGSTETVQFTGSEISSIEASVFLSSGSECTESARLSPIAAFSNGSAEMTPYAATSAAALCAKFSSSVWYNFAIALPVVSIETDKSYVATINTPVSIEISGENLGIFCPSTENVKLNDDEAFRSATTVACTSCAPEVASVSQLDSEFSMTLSESNVMDITFARRHHVESIVLSVPENVITSPKSVKLYAKAFETLEFQFVGAVEYESSTTITLSHPVDAAAIRLEFVGDENSTTVTVHSIELNGHVLPPLHSVKFVENASSDADCDTLPSVATTSAGLVDGCSNTVDFFFTEGVDSAMMCFKFSDKGYKLYPTNTLTVVSVSDYIGSPVYYTGIPYHIQLTGTGLDHVSSVVFVSTAASDNESCSDESLRVSDVSPVSASTAVVTFTDAVNSTMCFESNGRFILSNTTLRAPKDIRISSNLIYADTETTLAISGLEDYNSYLRYYSLENAEASCVSNFTPINFIRNLVNLRLPAGNYGLCAHINADWVRITTLDMVSAKIVAMKPAFVAKSQTTKVSLEGYGISEATTVFLTSTTCSAAEFTVPANENKTVLVTIPEEFQPESVHVCYKIGDNAVVDSALDLVVGAPSVTVAPTKIFVAESTELVFSGVSVSAFDKFSIVDQNVECSAEELSPVVYNAESDKYVAVVPTAAAFSGKVCYYFQGESLVSATPFVVMSYAKPALAPFIKDQNTCVRVDIVNFVDEVVLRVQSALDSETYSDFVYNTNTNEYCGTIGFVAPVNAFLYVPSEDLYESVGSTFVSGVLSAKTSIIYKSIPKTIVIQGYGLSASDSITIVESTSSCSDVPAWMPAFNPVITSTTATIQDLILDHSNVELVVCYKIQNSDAKRVMNLYLYVRRVVVQIWQFC